ncbi:MAG: ferritin-like domain-containing protein [Myxococcota bacterium]
MKRFIEPNELARDSRFIRQDNVASTMLSTLPDDVDAVVEAFERLDPIIEVSVRGTEAEPLYEEYGPGFGLVTLNEPLDPTKHGGGGEAGSKRLMLRMHGIFVGELQALEGAGRSLWDFPDAPWEFKMNMARQCWDETRHVQIYEKLLQHVGGYAGMFPESTFLFECACADDPALRVAGVNRALEGLACDVFRDMIKYADAIGDDTMKQAIDYVLADELTHVRFGSDWVKEFTKDDPDRYQRAQEFRRTVDKQFSFGGARSEREDAAIPIAWEDRKEAGFTDDELEDLKQLSGEGPSRETMRKAAKILRERHQARKAQAGQPQGGQAQGAPA